MGATATDLHAQLHGAARANIHGYTQLDIVSALCNFRSVHSLNHKARKYIALHQSHMWSMQATSVRYICQKRTASTCSLHLISPEHLLRNRDVTAAITTTPRLNPTCSPATSLQPPPSPRDEDSFAGIRTHACLTLNNGLSSSLFNGLMMAALLPAHATRPSRHIN
eukprot:jgi/Ulvmu1/6542/UM003_0176.1